MKLFTTSIITSTTLAASTSFMNEGYFNDLTTTDGTFGVPMQPVEDWYPNVDFEPGWKGAFSLEMMNDAVTAIGPKAIDMLNVIATNTIEKMAASGAFHLDDDKYANGISFLMNPASTYDMTFTGTEPNTVHISIPNLSAKLSVDYFKVKLISGPTAAIGAVNVSIGKMSVDLYV